jgi:hypothetical protein
MRSVATYSRETGRVPQAKGSKGERVKLSRQVNGSSGGACLLKLMLDSKRSVYVRSVALVTFGLLVLAGYGSALINASS